MSTYDTRREQMYPKLSAEDINRLRRFGEVRRYGAGERMFTTGEISAGMFVIIDGIAAITWRDGLGDVVPIIEQGAGEFLGGPVVEYLATGDFV